MMKYLHYVLFVSLFSAAAVYGQNSVSATTASGAKTKSTVSGGTKRGPIFRATKDQILAVQRMLKGKGMYSGEAIGKLDPATRDSITTFQKGNGLRASGTLNRATLEKMGIELTEGQKAIPISNSSYASAKSSDGSPPRRAVFRATKEQVLEAQKLLRTRGMYAGAESGKLDDITREGLKKYQEANGLKATGTLNSATLGKMGISLTDKQKASGGTK
jgi:peptidoglycan hydrolase-like protein with peptidoglycan-binding domain